MKKRKIVADVDFFSGLEKSKEVIEIINTIENVVVALTIDEQCKPYDKFLDVVKNKLCSVTGTEHSAFLYLRNRKTLFNLVVYTATHLELWNLTKSLLDTHSFIQDPAVICDVIIPHLCHSSEKPDFMCKLLKLIETMYLTNAKYLDKDVLSCLLIHLGPEKVLLLCVHLEKTEFVALILPKVDKQKWTYKRSPFQLCKTVEMFNLLRTHLNPSMQDNAGIAKHLMTSNTEMVLTFLQTEMCQHIPMRTLTSSSFHKEIWNVIVNYVDVDEQSVRIYYDRPNLYPLFQILVERGGITSVATLRSLVLGISKSSHLDDENLPHDFRIDGPYPPIMDNDSIQRILDCVTLLRTVLNLLPNESVMEVIYLCIRKTSTIIFDESLNYLTVAHGPFQRNEMVFKANFLLRLAGNWNRNRMCYMLYEKFAGVRLVPFKGFQASRIINRVIDKQAFHLYKCIYFGGQVERDENGNVMNRTFITKENATRYEYTFQFPMFMFQEIRKYYLPLKVDLTADDLDVEPIESGQEYSLLYTSFMHNV